MGYPGCGEPAGNNITDQQRRRAVSAAEKLRREAAGCLPVFGGCTGTRGTVRCTLGGGCKVSKKELLKDHRGSEAAGVGEAPL